MVLIPATRTQAAPAPLCKTRMVTSLNVSRDVVRCVYDSRTNYPSSFQRMCAAHESGMTECEEPALDFTLSPEIENIRSRTRAFVEEHVLPLEADPANFSEHENIPLDRLAPLQAKAKAAGLWA